ncbi:UDP-glucuronate 4-epimerase [bacterium A37T11]|nr:UDP-glucuronate 4-epimerase [bacterium A37T11]
MPKKILVTGAAGFIGFSLIGALLKRGDQVLGIDNINDYYDVDLKNARLANLGINPAQIHWHQPIKSQLYPAYTFIRMNLEDQEPLNDLCIKEQFDVMINLAAQPGVRYSINHPHAYAQANLLGFLSILEAARLAKVGHFIYASSSSVYGMNEKVPFSVTDPVDHPLSLYAATKKANELMAHSYSHLYGIPTTGLRFFTVYGPWGRPDMAYYLFAEAIRAGKTIKVFNHGQMKRDFTYIDDIVRGIEAIIEKPAQPLPVTTGSSLDPSRSTAPYRIYNIGNNRPVPLMDFIRELEINLGTNAQMEFLEMQPGDLEETWADISELAVEFGYSPDTDIGQGVAQFVEWFKIYSSAKKSY